MNLASALIANPFVLTTSILAVVVIVLIILVILLHLKLKRFLIGSQSKNIDDSLSHLAKDTKELQVFRGELETYLANVEKRLKKSVQSVHTVRFNPFRDSGGTGNQSFATALLTEEGDGVILSSLYSRNHVSIFSKPVKKHTTEHELSGEEAEALESAKKNLK